MAEVLRLTVVPALSIALLLAGAATVRRVRRRLLLTLSGCALVVCLLAFALYLPTSA